MGKELMRKKKKSVMCVKMPQWNLLLYMLI